MAALLLLVLGVLTWQQCHIYKDLETLWTDTLKKNPRCWMAHSNLGRLLVQQGKLDEAEAHYQAALAFNPAEETIHYNYANLLVKTGRLEDGVAHYRQALQLAPEKPETHCNLGFALNQQHRTAEFPTASRMNHISRLAANDPVFSTNRATRRSAACGANVRSESTMRTSARSRSWLARTSASFTVTYGQPKRAAID